MFTGLIRSTGIIRHREQRGDLRMEILPEQRGFPLNIGASIACHGICLTVAALTDDGAFIVELSAETVGCTNAGSWLTGMHLNLEPSLAVGDALGGHFVSGHIDGLAQAVRMEKSGDSTIWEFAAPAMLQQFIAPKGSVALNGVSLTVNQVMGTRFTVNIIAHTATATSFGTMRVGDRVNLEIDLLARYVARMLEART